MIRFEYSLDFSPPSSPSSSHSSHNPFVVHSSHEKLSLSCLFHEPVRLFGLSSLNRGLAMAIVLDFWACMCVRLWLYIARVVAWMVNIQFALFWSHRMHVTVCECVCMRSLKLLFQMPVYICENKIILRERNKNKSSK